MWRHRDCIIRLSLPWVIFIYGVGRFWKPPQALCPLMVPVLPVKWVGLPAAARMCRCPAAAASSELGL